MAVPARVENELRSAENALNEFVQAAEPTPAPPPPEAAPPAPAPVAQPTDSSQELQRLSQQMSSLQGLFQTSQSNNQQLMQELERLRAAPPAAKPTPSPAAKLSLLTEHEQSEYGDPFLDVVRRAAREDWKPVLDLLLSKIEKLELGVSATRKQAENAQQFVAQTAEEKFWEKLVTLVPSYEETNVDPKFTNWLQETAPYSKNTKHELLLKAAGELDAQTVARIFNDYLAANAPAPLPTTPPVDPANEFLSPSSVAPGTPSERRGQTWTRKDMDELYLRERKKQITPADFQRLEEDMILAMSEGRFVEK